jgi:hypothetical protein
MSDWRGARQGGSRRPSGSLHSLAAPLRQGRVIRRGTCGTCRDTCRDGVAVESGTLRQGDAPPEPQLAAISVEHT